MGRVPRVILAAIACLMLSHACLRAAIFEESFENAATARDTAFDIIHHDVSLEGNIQLSSAAHGGAKCLQWHRSDSGSYHLRTSRVLSSATGRFSISFWTNFSGVSMYNWSFTLRGSNDKPLLSLFEGYQGNANCDWGKLRCLNPDGTYRTLCDMKTGWRRTRIVVDLASRRYEVFYGDMSVPVGVDLPVMQTDVSGSATFRPSFDGYSSKTGDQKWSLDDFVIDALPPRTRATQQSGRELAISRSGTAARLSAKSGSITHLSRRGVALVGSTDDIYLFHGDKSSRYSRESADVVTSHKSNATTRTFVCKNAGLPGVVITKTYSLASDGILTKRVQFASRSAEGFITHIARIRLDKAFARDCLPGGCNFASVLGPGEASYVKNVAWATRPDFSAGVGAYRYRVNDRFVLPGQSTWNTDGWDVFVFCDYLRKGKSPSGQVRFVSFPGDFTAYEAHLKSLPECAALFADPKPAWVTDLICDCMYAATPDCHAMNKALDPLITTSTIWFLNPPWGNWWADSDPPKSLHHNVHGIAPALTRLAPNSKCAAYTNTTFDTNSDIFRRHRDFGVIDRDGGIVNSGWPSDSGGVPSYYLQILNPAARKYWLDMHGDRTAKWGLDFHYMDGPGSFHEIPDWNLRTVAQSYHWLDFYRDLKKRVKSVNPSALFFTNGIVPYSDIGYVEWGDDQWGCLAGRSASIDWRYLAKSLLAAKIRECPGYTVVPTYGNARSQPAISTYCIAYGWCGNLANIAYIPWMAAALEYRGLTLVKDAVREPWWRKDRPDYEAYALTKGGCAIVNVIGHSDKPHATVAIDCAKLGLQRNQTYLMRKLRMNDPASNPIPTRAFERSTGTIRVDSGSVQLNVPVAKGLLTSVILSKESAVVESTGARACETGINENYGVSVRLKSRGAESSTYSVATRFARATVFFPFTDSVEATKGVTLETAAADGVSGIRATFASAGAYSLQARSVRPE